MPTEEIFDFNKGLSDFYIALSEESTGLIINLLKRNNLEFYEFIDNDFDKLDCLYDDVHRIYNLVEFYNVLAERSDEDWIFFLTGDPNMLDLKSRDNDWLMKLKTRINIELAVRKWNDNDDE